MDIKSKKEFLLLALLTILFCSCEPADIERYTFVKNNSTENISSIFYPLFYTIPREYHILPSQKKQIFSTIIRTKTPEGFGDIGRFDSVVFILSENGKKLRWTRPSQYGGVIKPDRGIGEVREDVPLDIYNSDNWENNESGGIIEGIFNINEEDLTLFQ